MPILGMSPSGMPSGLPAMTHTRCALANLSNVGNAAAFSDVTYAEKADKLVDTSCSVLPDVASSEKAAATLDTMH
jgi:hypothetical protein